MYNRSSFASARHATAPRWGAGDRGVHWTRGDVRYSGRGVGVAAAPSTHSSYSSSLLCVPPPATANTSAGRVSAYHSSLPGVASHSPRIGEKIIERAGLDALDGVSRADLRTGKCVP